MKWRDRLAEGPPLILALVLAVVFAGLWFVLMVVLGLRPVSWTTVIWSGVAGAFFGTLMTLFTVWQRNRAGGAQTATAMNRAMKARHIPVDADPHEWMPLIERRARQAKRVGWIGPVEFGLGTVLVVYLALTDPSHEWFWWPEAVFMVALAVLSPILSHRQIKQLEELRRQFEARDRSPDAAHP